MVSRFNVTPSDGFTCEECSGLCTHGPMVPLDEPEWLTCEVSYRCQGCDRVYGRDDACAICRRNAFTASKRIRVNGCGLH